MNELELKERARERLFEAEVRDVFGMEVAAPAAAARRLRWSAAATFVLGLGVVTIIAISSGLRVAQEPSPFDPLRPRWEAWWDLWTNNVPLTSVHQLQQLDGSRALLVKPREIGLTLAQVMTTPGLRTLCVWGETEAGEWERGAEADEITRVAITKAPKLGREQLRQLRRLPNLRELDLTQSPARFTAECGLAVAELTRLQMLMLNEVDATAEGIAALAGLAELDTLLIWSNPSNGRSLAELTDAIGELRNLRALGLWPDAKSAFSTERIRGLARLPKLEVLDLGFGTLDDAALRALPDHLTALGLADLRPATAEGIRSLKRLTRLRGLELHTDLPVHLESAMAEVLADLPVEKLELNTASPDLLAALVDAQALSRLIVRMPQERDYAQFRQLRSLRELELHGREYPDPDHLAVMRGAPGLQVVRIHGEGPPSGAKRDAIREALGPDVRVEFPAR